MGCEESKAENSGNACLSKMVGKNEITGNKSSGFEKKNSMNGNHEFGDMVWGKVKSHPWWPGQIYSESLAVSSVLETKIEGQVLVAFFGDGTYGWFNPAELLPFDAYYAKKSRQTNAKSFVNAVDHAEYELSKRAALGLACCCSSNFKLMSVEELVSVDVCGYEPGGLYTIRQIRSARAGFQSVEMLNFVKHLALMPCAKFHRTIHWVRNVAIVVAYRQAVCQKYEWTYIEAYAAQPSCPVNHSADFPPPDKRTSQDDGPNCPESTKHAKITQEDGPNCPESTEHAKITQGEKTDGLSSTAKPPKKRMKPYATVTCIGNFDGKGEKSSGVPNKIYELRSSSIENKSTDGKCLKSQGKDHPQNVVSNPMKPIKNSLKKQETPDRVAKAAVLVMEFPSQSKLPSIPELKIKFVRFGPFDRPRIFWQSSTCQIVFRNESDAQVACRHAVENPNFFGSLKVQYKVQALPDPGQELPNVGKRYEQSASDEVPTTQPSLITPDLKSTAPQKSQLARIHPEIPLSKLHENKLQSTFGAPNINLNVKSKLSRVQNNKSDQSPVNSFIQKPSGSYANIVSSSLPPPIPGYNAKNFIKSVPPLPHSYLNLDMHKSRGVYQFAEACNRQYHQVAERSNNAYETSQNVDISGAMLSLLNQCSAILADLKSTLGYVPYHL